MNIEQLIDDAKFLTEVMRFAQSNWLNLAPDDRNKDHFLAKIYIKSFEEALIYKGFDLTIKKIDDGSRDM